MEAKKTYRISSMEDIQIDAESIMKNEIFYDKVHLDYKKLLTYFTLRYGRSNFIKKNPQYFNKKFYKEFLQKYIEEWKQQVYKKAENGCLSFTAIEDVLFEETIYDDVKEYFEQEVFAL